jgi:hypothetical protein
MLKLSVRILALAALGSAVAAPRPSHAASTDNHAAHRSWSHAYLLTPLEHKRLRAYGLKDIEIFLIANAATQTGLDVDSVRQLYLVHPPVWGVIADLKIDPSTLTRLHPEWTTPEWQEAVKRGDYAWLPSQSPTGREAGTAMKSTVQPEERAAGR